ncbi:MAG: ornithine carbamoyltransferase, partial [Methyloceanibacter sp.]
MQPRHFLDIDTLDRQTLRAILNDARAMKAMGRGRLPDKVKVRPGAVLAMIFEQPSTRTRVSFEVAMHELGGTSIMLSRGDMQIGRGETIADTARVLSRYVDAIMLRTGPHETLLELAEHATVP